VHCRQSKEKGVFDRKNSITLGWEDGKGKHLESYHPDVRGIRRTLGRGQGGGRPKSEGSVLRRRGKALSKEYVRLKESMRGEEEKVNCVLSQRTMLEEAETSKISGTTAGETLSLAKRGEQKEKGEGCPCRLRRVSFSKKKIDRHFTFKEKGANPLRGVCRALKRGPKATELMGGGGGGPFD